MRTSAEVIRDKAHEALTDLRGVLGVLRDDDDRRAACAHRSRRTPTCPAWSPRPAAAGLRLEYDDLVAGHRPMPDAVGRTLYRIVQEGITNARKHAPGALLSGPGQRHPGGRGGRRAAQSRWASARPGRPARGSVWSGWRSGPSCAAGASTHGRDGSMFVLHAWIPWAT